MAHILAGFSIELKAGVTADLRLQRADECGSCAQRHIFEPSAEAISHMGDISEHRRNGKQVVLTSWRYRVS